MRPRALEPRIRRNAHAMQTGPQPTICKRENGPTAKDSTAVWRPIVLVGAIYRTLQEMLPYS